MDVDRASGGPAEGGDTVAQRIEANRTAAAKKHATIFATVFSEDGRHMACGDSLGCVCIWLVGPAVQTATAPLPVRRFTA